MGRGPDEVYFSRGDVEGAARGGGGLVAYDADEAFRSQRPDLFKDKGPQGPRPKRTPEQREAARKFWEGVREYAEKLAVQRHNRERERFEREGVAWEEPDPDDEAAQDDEDARLAQPFDKKKDYYKILGVDVSATTKEIKDGYRRKSLKYHPDKQHGKSEEEVEKAKVKFQVVNEAYLVLSDEPTRRAYDKTLDPEIVNGKSFGKMPKVRPRTGRVGDRVKGVPTIVDFHCTLEELYSGCLKHVEFTRRIFAPRTNEEQKETKLYHLIVSRGSAEGERYEYENAGDESETTLPGDVVFVLREKHHERLSRMGARGSKDLLFRRTGDGGEKHEPQLIGPRQACFVERVYTPSGLWLPAVGGTAQALLYGVGRVACVGRVKGMGMPDAVNPLKSPPGDVLVEAICPPSVSGTAALRTGLHPRPVHLLASGADGQALAAVASGVAAAVPASPQPPLGVLLLAGAHWATPAASAAAEEWEEEDEFGPPPSAAPVAELDFDEGERTAATVRAALVPSDDAARLVGSIAGALPQGFRWRVVAVGAGSEVLDDERTALEAASVVVLDVPAAPADGACASPEPALRHAAEVEAIGTTSDALEAAGMRELLFRRYWQGAALVGVGGACALLGHVGAAPLLKRRAATAVPHIVRTQEGDDFRSLLDECTGIECDLGGVAGVGLPRGCAVRVGVDHRVEALVPGCEPVLASAEALNAECETLVQLRQRMARNEARRKLEEECAAAGVQPPPPPEVAPEATGADPEGGAGRPPDKRLEVAERNLARDPLTTAEVAGLLVGLHAKLGSEVWMKKIFMEVALADGFGKAIPDWNGLSTVGEMLAPSLRAMGIKDGGERAQRLFWAAAKKAEKVNDQVAEFTAILEYELAEPRLRKKMQESSEYAQIAIG